MSKNMFFRWFKRNKFPDYKTEFSLWSLFYELKKKIFFYIEYIYTKMSPNFVFLCVCIPSVFFLKFDMERSNV